MKAPHARERFIREYLFDNVGHVDVLNTDFALAYWEFTECKGRTCMYGAPKIPALARDLASMAKAGALDRHRTGIQGVAGMGFPRWVWAYTLTRVWRDIIANERKTVTPVIDAPVSSA